MSVPFDEPGPPPPPESIEKIRKAFEWCGARTAPAWVPKLARYGLQVIRERDAAVGLLRRTVASTRFRRNEIEAFLASLEHPEQPQGGKE